METASKGGSILYKAIIAVLIVVLIISLYIPRQIWNQETMEEQECHDRLYALLLAETYYKQKTNTYSTSFDTLLAVLKTDPQTMAEMDTTYTNYLFSDQDSVGAIQNIPLDSAGVCPTTGLPYSIAISDSIPALILSCPNEEGEASVYGIFKKKIHNHGNIKDDNLSWK